MDFGALTIAALRVLPFIHSLIKVAEGIFGKGTGEVKKSFVKTGAKSLVDNIKDISTGGQRETWERIERHVDTIIDSSVEAIFPHDETGTFNH